MITLLYVYLSWYLSKVWHKRHLIGTPEDKYLLRFHLVRIAKGSWLDRFLTRRGIKTRRIFLHRIYREDRDRHLHNHPWTVSRSLILMGGYQEQRNNRPLGWHFRWDWNVIESDVYHSILKVLPNTWTLFFAGYRDREWGFLTPEGHVLWTNYLNLPEGTDLDD